MASHQYSRPVDIRALNDTELSPQAVAVAAVMIDGGNMDALRFHEKQISLAMWELERAGYLARKVG